MQDINDRMQIIVDKHYGGKKAEFARALNLPPTSMSNYLGSRRSKPSSEIIEKILNVVEGLSSSWLISGEGSMYTQKTCNRPGVQTITPGDIKEDDYSGTLVYDVEATCGFEEQFLEGEHIIGSINLPEVRKKGTLIIRARGDSMTPKVCDGDMIAIRPVLSYNDIFYGQIYVVITADYLMIKQIRKHEADEENFVILHSANEEYDDMTMRRDRILKLYVVENILAIKTQL